MTDLASVLAEVTAPFADTRIHHCQVSLIEGEDRSLVVSGTMLDGSTRSALAAALTERLPELTVDLSGLALLRRPDPIVRRAGTNLMGLHAQPSFGSEQVSQLLNGVPLEELQQQDSWIFVRQPDGYLGWVYGPYLDEETEALGQPTHLVVTPVSPVRAEPQLLAPMSSRVLGGTGVAVQRIEQWGKRVSDGWAQVILAGGRSGWLPLIDLRGVDDLPTGEADRRSQIVADARRYMGIPYMWGGTSGMGIDCSGLAQLTHRLSGVTLPRDADMQFDVGRPVQAPFQDGDLLFFASGSETRSITHVGISLGGWRIIHASRSQNGVYEDDVRAVDHLRESFVGARTFLVE